MPAVVSIHEVVNAKSGKTLRLVRLILQFYRRFCVISLLISLYIVYESASQGAGVIAFSFWIKAITVAIIGGFVYFGYQHEFYYYKNLGIGKRTLLIAVTSLDLFLYMSMVFIVSGLYD